MEQELDDDAPPELVEALKGFVETHPERFPGHELTGAVFDDMPSTLSPVGESHPAEKRHIHQPTPTELLLAKMDAWLLQQPEFIAILNSPRSTRRRAAQVLAKHITTYPMRGEPFGGYLD